MKCPSADLFSVVGEASFQFVHVVTAKFFQEGVGKDKGNHRFGDDARRWHGTDIRAFHMRPCGLKGAQIQRG